MIKTRRFRTVGLLGLPLLALGVAVLVLTWGASGATSTQATTEDLKTNMTITISQGGNTVCTTVPNQLTPCNLELNSTFRLDVVPDVIPPNGYVGFQTLIDYGSFTYKPKSFVQPVFPEPPVPKIEIEWDLSFLPVRAPNPPSGKEGQIAHSDASGAIPPFPPSFQKTAFVNIDLNCGGNSKTPGQAFNSVIVLIPISVTPSGASYTQTGTLATFSPNTGAFDVSCKPPPTATNTPTQTPTETAAAVNPRPKARARAIAGFFWSAAFVRTQTFKPAQICARSVVVLFGSVGLLRCTSGPGPQFALADAFAAIKWRVAARVLTIGSPETETIVDVQGPDPASLPDVLAAGSVFKVEVERTDIVSGMVEAPFVVVTLLDRPQPMSEQEAEDDSGKVLAEQTLGVDDTSVELVLSQSADKDDIAIELRIDEIAPVGGIAVDPELSALALEAEGSSGGGTSVVAGGAIALIVGAVALGGAARYASTRRSTQRRSSS